MKRLHSPLIAHSILDNASLFDSEELLYTPGWEFTADLIDEMSHKSLADLRKLYPELTFSFYRDKKKPAGWDYAKKVKSGFVVAKWRVA